VFKLYINGKFYDRYLSLEVCLVAARKYLKKGDDIEIRHAQPTFASYIHQVEFDHNALPN